MPEEILALLIVISGMIFVFSVIKSLQRHALKKLEYQSHRHSDDSLTTSELQQMITEAVAEATAPIEDDLVLLASRIDAVEGGTGRIRLEEGEEVQEKTLGRSVRQREG